MRVLFAADGMTALCDLPVADQSGADTSVANDSVPDWFKRALAEQPESATIDVDGHAIHYLRWGGDSAPETKATPVLLVHGNGAHARWWSFVAPFLAARGRPVVALDLGGMGDSEGPPQPGIDAFARQVAAVAEHVPQRAAAPMGDGGKVALVGHSFGGLVSSAAVALRPELFARLVVIDSPFHIGRRPDWRRNARNHSAVYRSEAEILSRFRLLPAQAVEPAAALDFIARHSIAPAPAGDGGSGGSGGGGGWTWKFRIDPWESPHMPNTIWTTVGERIRDFPGLRAYLRGELSSLCPPEVETTWREFAGEDAPLIVVPHAHHHAILDQPLAVVAALEALFATT